MAIIYTYPEKASPVDGDLVLISDSADSNNTKQVKVSSIRGATVSGVADVNISAVTSTLSSGAPLVSLPNSGNVIITSRAYAGAANVGHVPTGGSATTFLRGDGSWIVPTNTTYDIMGSGNSYAAGLVLAGNATHNNNFLRKDGTWATPVDTGISFSGSTANGLIAYSNSTTAAVSSNFTLTADQLRISAGSVSAPSLNFTDVGGVYSASGGYFLTHTGSNSIGFTSASVINYKINQFNSGLKFGSSGSTLSTYTEATWTSGPTLTFSVGGATTLSASAGSYRVIGDMVFAQFQFTFGSGGYGTADLSLPVSGVAGTGSINFVKMNSNVGNSTVSTPVTGDILTNAASIRLKSFNYDQDSASHVSGQLFELVDTSAQPIFQNGDIVSGTIIYRKS